MCMYSATAENSRDARQGEDLSVTQAPHGCSNWLTENGKPNIAVCIPHSAVLAVQLPKQAVRGASFEQAKRLVNNDGNRDFINYLDGGRERVALNDLPKSTKIRVLHLFANVGRAPVIPATIGREAGGELVGAGTSGGSRRGWIASFFPGTD